MKASYYANVNHLTPGAIAISLYPPRGSKYLHFPKLAPSPKLLQDFKRSPDPIQRERDYIIRFYDQLHQLEASQVWDELQSKVEGETEPVILCYEKPPDFCHRQLVAKWFFYHLGENVEELPIRVRSRP
jgi:uncharacterized protein (DUF488 family)